MPAIPYKIGAALVKRRSTFEDVIPPKMKQRRIQKLVEKLPQGWKAIPVDRLNILREVNAEAEEAIRGIEEGTEFLALEVEGEQQLHILELGEIQALLDAEVDGEDLVTALRP